MCFFVNKIIIHNVNHGVLFQELDQIIRKYKSMMRIPILTSIVEVRLKPASQCPTDRGGGGGVGGGGVGKWDVRSGQWENLRRVGNNNR